MKVGEQKGKRGNACLAYTLVLIEHIKGKKYDSVWLTQSMFQN